MSLKFRRDGAVFPTEVKDGTLYVRLGFIDLPFKFPFLNKDYPYDSTDFPMSNIMVYLKNSDETIIMRFDGTVTKYNKDNIVIGFTKFNVDDLYQYTNVLKYGIVAHMKNGKTDYQSKCNIYLINDCEYIILECIGDQEPIVLDPKQNPIFMEELVRGNRYFPRLVNVQSNVYADDGRRYVLVGTPIRNTGFIKI